MKETFGEKVRLLREGKQLTREEFCGDETELSIRQLARIESGKSTPNLARAQFIAQQLGVGLGELTDGKSLELPKRYTELKYLILRTPTYMDAERLRIREEQFDEIYEKFYEELPEDEQLTITFIQSKFEVYQTGDTEFGTDVIEDYFKQVQKKKLYTLNDIVLIDLFLTCSIVSNFTSHLFDNAIYELLSSNLIKQSEYLPIEDLPLLNSVLLVCADASVRLEKFNLLSNLLSASHSLMTKIQDFQKMPIYNMLMWEYYLFGENNYVQAENHYNQSILFAKMMSDIHLAEKLEKEWEMDNLGK